MLLGDIVRLNGRKTPSRVAIVSEDRTVTFGELRDRMFRVANAMLGLASPGDRVAILAENLPEYVECYYGVPSAGMALNFLNYRLHPKEWAWILNNAEARGADRAGEVPRSDRGRTRRHPVDRARRRHRRATVAAASRPTTTWSGSAPAVEPDVEVDEDATAWLLYTSGTTGFPKGAMLTPPQPHRRRARIGDRVRAAARTSGPSSPFPLCHVAGVQRSRHAHPRWADRAHADVRAGAWMQLVDEHGITGTALAPTMLNFILQHPKIDEYELSSAARHRLRRRRPCRSRCCAPRSTASARSSTPASA